VPENYELVQLKSGAFSIRSVADGETFHPVAGPVAEAEALYVRQLRLRERVVEATTPFVIWDVGLGAGGNVLTAIRALADLQAAIEVHSFDQTLGAMQFARAHATQLAFPVGFESVLDELAARREAAFHHARLNVRWRIHLGDFPALLASEAPMPAPHAVFFDAFSPRANAEMWTLPVFTNLRSRLSDERSCALATFSRSTMARTTMLLAGFFVGAGESVAGKEETTVAANTLLLVERPLDRVWLERARISQSAEPLVQPTYRQARLSDETWTRLKDHPQFAPAER
jgi:tRNA U34 5-methylaminomethyl-2-thiouridine-forming methyltransferase MnmC